LHSILEGYCQITFKNNKFVSKSQLLSTISIVERDCQITFKNNKFVSKSQLTSSNF